MSSDKRKCIKKIIDKTLTVSTRIWQSHRVMTIQENLMVL